MTRIEFLKSLGLGGSAIFALTCAGGLVACSSTSSSPSAPQNVNFTLDLSSPANVALNTVGGYVYSGGVMVARTNSGVFIALSQYCTHAGTSVQYISSSDNVFCPNHGARFSKTGSVINGPATTGLQQYTVTQSGTILTIKS